MDEETRNNEVEGGNASAKDQAAEIAEKDKRIKELEEENRDIKAKYDDIKRKHDKLKADQEATERRTRAEKFVKSLEERGYTFRDDDDREAELNRLAGLSDEAFKATETAYSRVEFPKNTGQDGNSGRNSAGASGSGSMRSNARVNPVDVEDSGDGSLEETLRNGFMAAYNDRVGSSGE